MIGRYTQFVGLLLMPMVLQGCPWSSSLVDQHRVEYSDEAANVFVSAYPAVAWSDIADKLEPKNNLTIAEARALTAVTTQTQMSQVLSTFGAGLGVGLLNQAENLTTTIAADGTETITGTKTKTSGSVPSSSGMPPSTIPIPSSMPSLTQVPLASGIDGHTLLTAGTALFQQAAVLDNQISKAIWPEKYLLHLVTFQINVQPRQKSLGYDTYVDIDLQPSSWALSKSASAEVNSQMGGLPPVMVYPLIIADALEATNVGRSLELIRQASMELSGVVSHIGVKAGAGGGTDTRNSLIGIDKNSLVTVGRVNEHSVRVRLGAENAGLNGVAMSPRSYNVSLVVLSRYEHYGNADVKNVEINRLQVVTNVSLMSSYDGQVLKSNVSRDRKHLATLVARKVYDFGYAPVDSECGLAFKPVAADVLLEGQDGIRQGPLEAKELAKSTAVEQNLELLRAVDRQDYVKVGKCLKLTDSLSPTEEVKLRRFISAVSQLEVDSRYSTMVVALKTPQEIKVPKESQLVALLDDKKQTTAIVRGGGGLTKRLVSASLKLDPTKVEKPADHLVASGVSISPDGADVTVVFPSLSKLGIEGALIPVPLQLTVNKVEHMYPVRLRATTEAKVTNPVSTSQAVLVANALGVARISFQVSPVPKDFVGQPLWRLVVDGADVRADASIGAVAPLFNGVAVSPSSVVTLSLGNLSSARLVTIKTMDKDDAVLGDPIVLTVVEGSEVGK